MASADTTITVRLNVENPVAEMFVQVVEWSAGNAKAWVEISFESFSLGGRWVDEPTLMVLTGCADEPVLMVGRRFERALV